MTGRRGSWEPTQLALALRTPSTSATQIVLLPAGEPSGCAGEGVDDGTGGSAGGALPTSTYAASASTAPLQPPVLAMLPPPPPPSALSLGVAAVTLGGRSASGPPGANQDDFLCMPRLAQDASLFLAAVFDGHGPCGDVVSAQVRLQLPRAVAAQPALAEGRAGEALAGAFEDLQCMLVGTPDGAAPRAGIDTSLSGTTAVAVLIDTAPPEGGPPRFVCANTGDSRAILISLPEAPTAAAASVSAAATATDSRSHSPGPTDSPASSLGRSTPQGSLGRFAAASRLAAAGRPQAIGPAGRRMRRRQRCWRRRRRRRARRRPRRWACASASTESARVAA